MHLPGAVEHGHSGVSRAPRSARGGGSRAGRGCPARRPPAARAAGRRRPGSPPCSTSPCVVRSPARRITSTSSATAAKLSITCSRMAGLQWMSPAAAIRRRRSTARTVPPPPGVESEGVGYANRSHARPGPHPRPARGHPQALGGRTRGGPHPLPARGQPRQLGARRAADAQRPGSDGPPRARRAGAEHPGEGGDEGRAPARGVAAEGLGRRRAGGPDLRPVGPAARRRGLRPRRAAAGARHERRRAVDRGRGRDQADGHRRARHPLREPAADRARAARADRLGGRSAPGPPARRSAARSSSCWRSWRYSRRGRPARTPCACWEHAKPTRGGTHGKGTRPAAGPRGTRRRIPTAR